MNQIDYNVIFDKLTFQIKSLQEGFNILAVSENMADFGRNFSHILRGSLLVSDVNLYFLADPQSQWQSVYIHNPESEKFTGLLRAGQDVVFDSPSGSPFGIAVTLPLAGKGHLGLLVGRKFDKTEFSELDKITLQMFIQMLDNAYQAYMQNRNEKQLNFSLNHRVLQLNSLIDTGIDLSKIQDSPELLSLALERAVSLTNASMGIIEVKKNEDIILSAGFPDIEVAGQVKASAFKIETTVEFNKCSYVFTLAEKETRQGITDFDETDKMLIEAIARQLIAAIETEQLHRESLDRERMRRDIEMASEIQKKIIPQKLPQIEGFDIDGINIPSLEVGGDYFDVIKLSSGKYVLVIADVSGKGVASGLLVNTLNATLNAYVENDFTLTDIAFRLNKVIYKASTPEKYITCFIAVLDPASGELEYVNAGHNPILLIQDGKMLKLEKGGVAFGMFDFGIPFESGIVFLEKDNRLLLYTDGITEAMDKDENEYSDERLENFFTGCKTIEAGGFIKELVADVRLHTGNTPQSDDITALYLVKK